MSTLENQNPADLRKNPRVEIPAQVSVRDTHSNNVIGQLVNLSIDGLMLMGSSCVSPGTVFQLNIPLTDGDRVLELSLGVECLWCQDANDSGSYWSGFHIIDISPEQRDILIELVGD